MTRTAAAFVVLAAALAFLLRPNAAAAGEATVDGAAAPAVDAALMRQEAMLRRLQDLEAARLRRASEGDGDPGEFQHTYVELLRQADDALRGVGRDRVFIAPRQRLANDYFEIATFTRFRLHRAEEALGLYARSADLGSTLGRIGLADTYGSDLADRRHAIDLYRVASLRRSEAETDEQGWLVRLDDALRSFARQQVVYLESGDRYTRRLKVDDLAECDEVLGLMPEFARTGNRMLLRAFVGDAAARNLHALRGHELEAVLDGIPPSPLVMAVLMDTAPNVASVAALNAFLARHDPAGYWTACLFAITLYSDARAEMLRQRLTPEQLEARGKPPTTGRYSPVLLAAARDFTPQRAIVDIVRVNAHLGSPEQAWEHFLASLRSGRRVDALDCLTPELRARFSGRLGSMSPRELQAAGRSFSRLELRVDIGAFREYAVTRHDRSGDKAAMITFERRGPEWFISEM